MFLGFVVKLIVKFFILFLSKNYMSKRGRNTAFVGVLLLGLASLFNDIGSEMITPIMPLFLQALGGGGIVIGLVGGFRDGISSIVKFFSGYYSDRIGKRKVFVTSGYFTSFIFKFFLAFSTTANQALGFSAAERFGKLRDAPRDVMLSKLAGKKKKGRSFGLHQALDQSGGIIGGILAVIFFWYFGLTFKTIILIASVFSFISLIPIFFVKEISSKPRKSKLLENLHLIPKKLWFLVLIIGIFALANFSYMFFILKAGDFFSSGIGLAGVPIILFVIFNIFYAMFSYPFGILADKIGKKKVILSGYILFGLTVVGFIFAKSLILFIPLFIIYGLSYALVEGNQRALVADIAPESIKGSSIGIFHTTKGVCALFGSLIAGIIWNYSHTIVFIYGGVVSIIAILMLSGFKVPKNQ